MIRAFIMACVLAVAAQGQTSIFMSQSGAPAPGGATLSGANEFSNINTFLNDLVIQATSESALQITNAAQYNRLLVNTDHPAMTIFDSLESFSSGTRNEVATYGDIHIYPITISSGSGKQTSQLILDGNASGSAPDGNYLLSVRDYQYSNGHNGAPVTFITTNGQIWTGRELHASGNYDNSKTGDQFAYYKPFQTSSGGVTSCMLGVAGDELGAAFQLTCPDPNDNGGQNTYLMLGGYSSWNSTTPASSTFAATFAMEASGKLWWGSVTNPATFSSGGVAVAPASMMDTNLYRSAAGTLKTDSALLVSKSSAAAFKVQDGSANAVLTVDSNTPGTTFSLPAAGYVNYLQTTDNNQRMLTITPSDYGVATGDSTPVQKRFNITLNQGADDPGSSNRKNKVVTIGWNNDASGYPESLTEPVWCDRWEAGYNQTGTDMWKERHIAQLVTVSGGASQHLFRAASVNAKWLSNLAMSGDPNVFSWDFEVDSVSFSGKGTGTGTGTQYFKQTNSEFAALASSSYWAAGVNNQKQFKQLNAAGSAYKALVWLNSSDVVQIGESGINANAAGDLSVAGNLSVSTAGKGLAVKTGSNCKMGLFATTTWTNAGSYGTVTVNTTAVTANSVIFVTSNTQPVGRLYVVASDIVAGTSFAVRSSSTSESAGFNWIIIEPS